MTENARPKWWVVGLCIGAILSLQGRAALAVCLPPTPNQCSSTTSCTFQGLSNTALGGAQLSIDGFGRLVIGSIGSSGNDGVLVDNPATLTRDSHEEWIELGIMGWQPIGPVTTTLAGSFVRAQASAQLSNSGATQSMVLLIDESPNDTIRITPNFGATGTTTVRYGVYQDGVLVGTTSDSATSQPATTTAWPVQQGFSFVRWSVSVPITLPGTASGVRTGNELRIVPQTATTVVRTFSMQVTVKNATVLLGPALATLTVNEERFLDASVCVASGGVPALSKAAQVGLALALMAALGLVLLVSRRPL